MNKTKTINIRRSNKFMPIIKRVEEFANQQNRSELTSAFMDLVLLGLTSHDKGLRLVDNELISIKQLQPVKKTLSVRREVARSVFTSLAGSLVDLSAFEESKEDPNLDKIEFYRLARKTLYIQHANFRNLTDSDVENIFNLISPILKSVRLAETKEEREHIIETNKHIFENMIQKDAA